MTNEKSLQTPIVTQKVVGKCSPCNPNSNRCYLCLYEKLKIAAYQANNLLKKKKRSKYQYADIKANTHFPSMTSVVL